MPHAKRTHHKAAGRADFTRQVVATHTSAREQLLDTVKDNRVREWLGKLLGKPEESEVIEMGVTANTNGGKT